MSDFSDYDSSDAPTLTESIYHSLNNPMLITSLSDYLMTEFNGIPYLVQEPSCAFRDLVEMYFSDKMVMTTIPESEFYRPEITAKRLYRNADLWYTILPINNIFSVTEYNKPRIKTIPPSELEKIVKFIYMSKNTIRTVNDADISDRIL